MKILLIDNYDSFTYNLVHCIEKIANCKVDVFRNDELDIEGISAYDKIVLSPGPGIPDEAGSLKQIIRSYAAEKPIFGVCLGLQAITEVFGGRIMNMEKVYHGVATRMEVIDEDEILFKDIPKRFLAGRYHSWIADEATFPDALKVSVRDEDGQIMALSHRSYNIRAVQFHPESVLTEYGQQIIENFINKT